MLNCMLTFQVHGMFLWLAIYVAVPASLASDGTAHSVMIMIFVRSATWQTSMIWHMLLFGLILQRQSGNENLHSLYVTKTILTIIASTAVGWATWRASGAELKGYAKLYSVGKIYIASALLYCWDTVPAFRVRLGANDLNYVDVPLNPTHSLLGIVVV